MKLQRAATQRTIEWAELVVGLIILCLYQRTLILEQKKSFIVKCIAFYDASQSFALQGDSYKKTLIEVPKLMSFYIRFTEL